LARGSAPEKRTIVEVLKKFDMVDALPSASRLHKQ
jgi:hypothetical protein